MSPTRGDRSAVGGSSPRSESLPIRPRLVPPVSAKTPPPVTPPAAPLGRRSARPRRKRKVFQVTRHRRKSHLVEKPRERGRGDHNNHIVALSARMRLSVVADAARAT